MLIGIIRCSQSLLGSVHLKSVGGAGKRGGHANSVLDLGGGGGPGKFRIGFGGVM